MQKVNIYRALAWVVALILIGIWTRKARAEEKDRCGYTPLRTGPWDPFINACRLHDYYYETKEVTQSQADETFAAVVRHVYRGSAWWKRPFLTVWGEAYITIVAMVGGRFW